MRFTIIPVSIIAISFLFVFVNHSSLVFSQELTKPLDEIRPDKIILDGNVEWHLISVSPTFVGKSLSNLAEPRSFPSTCGGANGGWLERGWMFKDNKWLLVSGSDSTAAVSILSDIKQFSAEHASFGLWVRLDVTKTKGKLCALSCGTTSCQPLPAAAVQARNQECNIYTACQNCVTRNLCGWSKDQNKCKSAGLSPSETQSEDSTSSGTDWARSADKCTST